MTSTNADPVFYYNRDPYERIVGGTQVTTGRYPYFAALFFTSFSPGQFNLADCGGTLITPNIVVSAAHCHEAVQVVLGCLDLTDTASCEFFDIKETILHPDFEIDPKFLIPQNDIMILVLDGNSSHAPVAYLDNSIGPTFDPSTLQHEMEATIMGFGSTALIGGGSSIMLETQVSYISNDECIDLYATNGKASNVIEDNMLCLFSSGEDSCKGDSGGPSILPCDLTEDDILIGVVSWGFGCAEPGLPGVYARISKFTDFIDEQVAAKSVPFGAGSIPSIQYSSGIGFSFDSFCTEGGTKAPTPPPPPPTSSPTIPLSWTCAVVQYGSFDGCHCNCGAVDPDCLVTIPPQTVFNCPSGSQCVDGECPTSAPTRFPTRATASPTTPPVFAPNPFDTGDSTSNGANVGLIIGLLVLFGVIGTVLGLIGSRYLRKKLSEGADSTEVRYQKKARLDTHLHETDIEVSREIGSLHTGGRGDTESVEIVISDSRRDKLRDPKQDDDNQAEHLDTFDLKNVTL